MLLVTDWRSARASLYPTLVGMDGCVILISTSLERGNPLVAIQWISLAFKTDQANVKPRHRLASDWSLSGADGVGCSISLSLSLSLCLAQALSQPISQTAIPLCSLIHSLSSLHSSLSLPSNHAYFSSFLTSSSVSLYAFLCLSSQNHN